MTQMASLLAVATVFVALWTLNNYILQSEQGGGLYPRQNYLCRNLSQKYRGGLYTRGAYLRDSTVCVYKLNVHP
jgi:hypothetical protein